MEVGQLVVVQAQQPHECDVYVADWVNDFCGFGSNFVSGSDDGSALYAAAGEPHVHGVHVVASTKRCYAAAVVVVRRSSELASPHDQRFIQHAASL